MITENLTRMTVSEKKLHLASFRERYANLGRKDKGALIDEACALLKWERKHAIKALNGKAFKGGDRKPYWREKTYGEDIIGIVLGIWTLGGRPCGPRLRAMIPLWLDGYEKSGEALDAKQHEKLLKCSARTLQNMTASHRLSGTRNKTASFSLSSHHIKTGVENVPSPWEPELSTWLRCNANVSAHQAAFLLSLTLTDTTSGWRELAGIFKPEDQPLRLSQDRINAVIPFGLPDQETGRTSNFVHETLGNWLEKSSELTPTQISKIPASGDRESGQACHSYTGHSGEATLAELVSDLYRCAWLPLRNHFLPVMKKVSKVRVGNAWKNAFDQPASPYQRLLASGRLDPIDERRLREDHVRLNPFHLANEISVRIQVINEAVKRLGIAQVRQEPGNPEGAYSAAAEPI